MNLLGASQIFESRSKKPEQLAYFSTVEIEYFVYCYQIELVI